MLKNHPQISKTLLERNTCIARYWLTEPKERNKVNPKMHGKKVLIIDAEDAFTWMLAQMLESMGLFVTVRRYDTVSLLSGSWDLFVMGPGPGDPLDASSQKIHKLNEVMTFLTSAALPFLAICLSHQILCASLGLTIIRKRHPNQGKQQRIDIFGVNEVVGFYNTFVARCQKQELINLQEMNVVVSLDNFSRDVHALKGPSFSSFQFHPESLLTLRGIDIITSSINEVMKL